MVCKRPVELDVKEVSGEEVTFDEEEFVGTSNGGTAAELLSDCTDIITGDVESGSKAGCVGVGTDTGAGIDIGTPPCACGGLGLL